MTRPSASTQQSSSASRGQARHIVVVGGGPVGLAFALGAAQLRGIVVTVIEKRADISASVDQPDFDHRVYALSPASMQFLRDLGVGAHLRENRLTAVSAMRVFGDGAANADNAASAGNADAATFEATRSALPEITLAHAAPLATMIEHRHLLTALTAACAQVDPDKLRFRAGVAIASATRNDAGHGINVVTAEETFAADLLIGADGRRSQVRDWFALGAVEHDYESDAVVANFVCARDHQGVAFQWFSPDGVLAYLPLPSH